MPPSPSWMHGRVVVGSMVGGALLVAALAWRTPGPPTSPNAAALSMLDARVAGLEAALGTPSATVRGDGPAGWEPAYRDLRTRVERLAAVPAAAWRRIPSIPPVPGATLTSPYTSHRLHPILRTIQPHYGADFAAPAGTWIVATADGTVAATVTSPTYGLAIDIDHGNGLITRYAHAEALLVRPGDWVQRGEPIARVGSSGLSTGPHCHYEVFRNGWSVDPRRFVLIAGLAIDGTGGGPHD